MAKRILLPNARRADVSSHINWLILGWVRSFALVAGTMFAHNEDHYNIINIQFVPYSKNYTTAYILYKEKGFNDD